MNEQGSVVEFSAKPVKEMQLTMCRMDRRQWWLWSYAVMVTLLLLTFLRTSLGEVAADIG
ncbi:MAG: hypothetical protein DMG32_22170 [Acidobacteria bacterium]|nr:MAG: hypothetical protein DMG32_22170 [Acidobacteriota bacterium]